VIAARLIISALLVAMTSACQLDELRVPPAPDGAGGGGNAPSLPTDLEAGWNEILPGGETICSRGTDYAFYVRRGTVNKVVIDFIGGGACWNAFTCGAADAIFQPDVEQVKAVVNAGIAIGFYDTANEQNPFRDWYHIVVPYCTGDVHWGDNVATYGSGDSQVTIHHKGAVNTRAVLDWVYQRFSAPEQVFVTGCSAGSYGSAMWAPHIIQHYPDTNVMQFGDSGAGVITKDFFQDSFPSWKAETSFPTWIDSLDPTKVNLLDLELADLYIGMAKHYPNNRFSQYNTAFDENQVFYFQAMGGGDEIEWSKQMYASIERIEEKVDNFSAFIPAGEQHCIVHFPNFYSVTAGGTKLVDWLDDMLNAKPLPSKKCDPCDGKTP
jgi:hypothetical protein